MEAAASVTTATEPLGVCFSCRGKFPVVALTVCPTCRESICLDADCDCPQTCRCYSSPIEIPTPPVKDLPYPFAMSFVKNDRGMYEAVDNPKAFFGIRVGFYDHELFGDGLIASVRQHDNLVLMGHTQEYIFEVPTTEYLAVWHIIKFPVEARGRVLIGGYGADITRMVSTTKGLIH